MARGKLIVLCGIDGCGKSSVIRALTEKNEAYKDFEIMKHPPKAWFDNPKIRAAYLDGEGEKIKDEDEISYVHELRKQEEKDVILPKLLQQENIIFHRYIFSLYAYYRGIDKYSIQQLTEIYSDLLLPDKVIYLKMSIEEFYVRFKHKMQLSYQKDVNYVKRCMECYEELAKMYQWEVIDTERNDLGSVVSMVKNIIEDTKVDDVCYDLKGRIYRPEP